MTYAACSERRCASHLSVLCKYACVLLSPTSRAVVTEFLEGQYTTLPCCVVALDHLSKATAATTALLLAACCLLQGKCNSSLPSDVLAHVLQHLDLKDRLASSLVCHTWNAAAAAATADITLTIQRAVPQHSSHASKPASLEKWLSRHGAGLRSLTVYGPPYTIDTSQRMSLSLPVQQLQQLQKLSVSGLLLKLEQPHTDIGTSQQQQQSQQAPAHTDRYAGSSSCSRHITASTIQHSSVGSIQHTSSSNRTSSNSSKTPRLAALSSLISLQLVFSALHDGPSGFGSLPALTALRELKLQHLRIVAGTSHRNSRPGSVKADSWQEQQQQNLLLSEALGTVLQRLQQLTNLDIDQDGLRDAALVSSLSCLQQLKELRLLGCSVTAASFARLPTSLTRLDVSQNDTEVPRVALVFDAASAAGICALTDLQHLSLPRAKGVHLSGMLTSLTMLTFLEVDGAFSGNVAISRPFSTLQQLQVLQFAWGQVKHVEYFVDLPPSLTALEVTWAGQETFSSSSVPGICQLTALQELKLSAGSRGLPSVHPGFLSALLQLRRLHLRFGTVEADGVQQLMAGLVQLQQLQHLDLSDNSNVAPLPPTAAMQYSALLASTQLTCLEVLYDTQMLADTACWHLFPAGRHLPNLKQLRLGLEWGWLAEGDYECSKPVGPGDIERLVRCCPALEELWIVGVVQWNVQLDSLVRLSGLTHLKIGGPDVDGAAAGEVLAALTQLKELDVIGIYDFSHVELCRLTRLSALQRLLVQDCGLSEEEDEEDVGVDLESQASPPDVWRQLFILLKYSREWTVGPLDYFMARHQAEREAAQQRDIEGQQREHSLQLQLPDTQAQLVLAQAQLQEYEARFGQLEEWQQ